MRRTAASTTSFSALPDPATNDLTRVADMPSCGCFAVGVFQYLLNVNPNRVVALSHALHAASTG
ncbi:hypothetical protein [Bacillus atrophaeus]|uniref:hypothetical protein n=1 Tax=Bacillus atrophaeus TaxID=1452 RepID=UPI002159E1A6|nr:hypothetical protein [Bacillus atrophaeus]